MPQNIFQNQLIKRKENTRLIIRVLKKLFPKVKIALNYSNNWELYVAVVLSAQCTDKKVNEVTAKLFKKYKILDDYVNADIKEFEQDIRPTGFYHNKAKNILLSAKIIKDKYSGKIPPSMNLLLSIPGVGRKTANIILSNAFGIVEGIAVDTHVKRLSRLLGLTTNNDPDKIEQDLMRVVPKKEWSDFTYLLIEYGRNYCPAKQHDHANCPLTKKIIL